MIFQSTFPRGERQILAWFHHPDHDFNPRSRVGNDAKQQFCHGSFSYFNPRSRVGNDPTHRHYKLCLAVFQSTFPRGERHSCHAFIFLPIYFNPRSRVGNDEHYMEHDIITQAISIHVPAWGTTKFTDKDHTGTAISIHVPAWGTTGTVKRDNIITIISIHVPAWGTTKRNLISLCHECHISIHVPAWGTTHHKADTDGYIPISIHVPAWGTTANFNNFSLIYSYK